MVQNIWRCTAMTQVIAQSLAAGEVHPTAPGATPIAVAVDWDNLYWSVRQHFGCAPNAAALLARAGTRGTIVSARAYADWLQPGIASVGRRLHELGLELA